MITITETMPCSVTLRPRVLEGASYERGLACERTSAASSGRSARCTAPRGIDVRGTGLPSSGLFGPRSAAAAGNLPTFATKQDTPGVRGWSPPV